MIYPELHQYQAYKCGRRICHVMIVGYVAALAAATNETFQLQPTYDGCVFY